MNNLFSTFDPSTSSIFSLNWISMTAVLLIPSAFWLVPSKNTLLLKKGLVSLKQEISLVNSLGFPNFIFNLLTSLFLLISLNNFMGLFPYVFTASSHLAFTLPLALTIWLGLTLISFWTNSSSFLAHLVPVGTPMALAPFMVFIEIISSIMRPFTLAIRLAANMIAGHLLLALLSGNCPSLTWAVMTGVAVGLLSILVLETAVAFIQGYVFTSLMSLYVSEVNTSNL